MKAFIFSAGRSKRMKVDKLLIQFKGETTTQRQIRLLRKLNVTDITVFANFMVARTLPDDVRQIITNTNPDDAFLKLLIVLDYIPDDDDILLLLGDLVYSEKALSEMLKADGNIVVFGIEKPTKWASHRWGGEIFSVKVKSSFINKFKQDLLKLDPKLHYEWWNIPKQLKLPIYHLEECTDVDFDGDIESINKLV
jgi:hypothetical protein